MFYRSDTYSHCNWLASAPHVLTQSSISRLIRLINARLTYFCIKSQSRFPLFSLHTFCAEKSFVYQYLYCKLRYITHIHSYCLMQEFTIPWHTYYDFYLWPACYKSTVLKRASHRADAQYSQKATEQHYK